MDCGKQRSNTICRITENTKGIHMTLPAHRKPVPGFRAAISLRASFNRSLLQLVFIQLLALIFKKVRTGNLLRPTGPQPFFFEGLVLWKTISDLGRRKMVSGSHSSLFYFNVHLISVIIYISSTLYHQTFDPGG